VLLLAIGTEKDENAKEDTSWAEEVRFPDFLAKVAAQQLKRVLKEDSRTMNDFVIREVHGQFDPVISNQAQGRFLFQLDIIRKPFGDKVADPLGAQSLNSSGVIGTMLRATNASVKNIEKKPVMSLDRDLLPLSLGEVSKLLKRYDYNHSTSIEVVEVNSGHSLIMPYR